MLIAGVDEAGRGPLAGPVVAAAVIIEHGQFPDSKKLSHKKRLVLYSEILTRAKSIAVCAIPPFIIDAINIRRASLLAMRHAVMKLKPAPDFVLIDGRDEIPGLKIEQQAIIGGDNSEDVIGAASIVAKVARDTLMQAYNDFYPQFAFGKHKGYPTPQHYELIQQFGITIIHRLTFRTGAKE